MNTQYNQLLVHRHSHTIYSYSYLHVYTYGDERGEGRKEMEMKIEKALKGTVLESCTYVRFHMDMR